MINIINEWEFKLSAYLYALTVIGFDNHTIASKDGADYRNERISFLSGEYYNVLTDENIYKTLVELNKDNSLNKKDKRKVKLYLKIFKDAKALTKEEYVEYDKLTLKANDVWENARETSDYKAFEPYLIKLFEFSKYIAKKRNSNVSAYDLFLDDYEEGMNIDKYDEFFNLIKERISPLVKEVNNKQDLVNTNVLNGIYNLDKQIKFNRHIMKYLGFEDSWSYSSVSVHPFTTSMSKNDIRITTRYKEDDILYSLFSTIHEVGHGMFEHQLSDEIEGTIFSRVVTSGIHESQSRLFENYLGRNISFWKYNYPILQKEFDFLKNVTLDDFVRSINASKPSFIRTEADELTYPLHILVRYEIEKGVFDGSIPLDNLNEVWNSKMKEYLGVDVPNDSYGILQDVHWSGGSFGYFPAYALGSAYAAQIFNAMEKELDVDNLLETNNFNEINKWLKDKVHNDGALLTPKEILIKATNEEFNPMYYIEYLEDKYKKLYEIK